MKAISGNISFDQMFIDFVVKSPLQIQYIVNDGAHRNVNRAMPSFAIIADRSMQPETVLPLIPNVIHFDKIF